MVLNTFTFKEFKIYFATVFRKLIKHKKITIIQYIPIIYEFINFIELYYIFE